MGYNPRSTPCVRHLPMKITPLILTMCFCAILMVSGCGQYTQTEESTPPTNNRPSQTNTFTPVSISTKESLSISTKIPTLSQTAIITHTIEPTLTPAQNVKGEGVYFYLHQVGYLFYYLVDPFRIIVLDEYDVGNGENIYRDISLNGPGDAQDLVFSNYSNQIAYWTLGDKGGLWISDLTFTNPQLLFVDNNKNYPTDFLVFPGDRINLVWTSDDLHLILINREDYSLNLIYHILTNTSE
jgi:hypothetical protein